MTLVNTNTSRADIINTLTSFYWGKKADKITTEEELTIFENEAQKKSADYLQGIFGNTPVAFCSAEFWIMTKTQEQAIEAKNKALELGFVNVSTIVPKVQDPKDRLKSINDPNHDFAVQVNNSESLIFGIGQKHLDIYKDSINVIKKHIIFTYAYNGHIKLTLNDKKAAEIFTNHMMQCKLLVDESMDNKTSDTYSIDVKMEEDALDSWDVSIHVTFIS